MGLFVSGLFPHKSLSEGFNCFIWFRKITLQKMNFLFRSHIFWKSCLWFIIYFELKGAQSLNPKHNSMTSFYIFQEGGKNLNIP